MCPIVPSKPRFFVPSLDVPPNKNFPMPLTALVIVLPILLTILPRVLPIPVTAFPIVEPIFARPFVNEPPPIALTASVPPRRIVPMTGIWLTAAAIVPATPVPPAVPTAAVTVRPIPLKIPAIPENSLVPPNVVPMPPKIEPSPPTAFWAIDATPLNPFWKIDIRPPLPEKIPCAAETTVVFTLPRDFVIACPSLEI